MEQSSLWVAGQVAAMLNSLLSIPLYVILWDVLSVLCKYLCSFGRVVALPAAVILMLWFIKSNMHDGSWLAWALTSLVDRSPALVYC